nr:PREDICTED: uncharacterized protein LOC109035696 [Bemisia tabaci]
MLATVHSFQTSEVIVPKILLLAILIEFAPPVTLRTTEYEPDSDEIFTFNDPFGDHETTAKVPKKTKREKSAKNMKKPTRTTTKEPDSDEVFTFFDPFGDHETTTKNSKKEKGGKSAKNMKKPTRTTTKEPDSDEVFTFFDPFGDHATTAEIRGAKAKDKDPFYLPWQDHKEFPEDSKRPEDWVIPDGGFEEEKGHLISDETTLFTFPRMTTTSIMRDEHGFPFRSRMFSPSEIKRKLKEYKIIPDVIDESQSPKIPCELLYSKMEPKVKGKHAVFGTKMETAIVRYEPFYVEWPTKWGERYTLLLISPDYPSRQNQTEKEYLHWMVINIPESFVTSGNILADYVSTIPEPHTGYHRYVVLIFKQKDELRVHRLHSSGHDPSRIRFNTRKFIKEYKLGTPYAMNFFESEWSDDSEFWTTKPPSRPPTTTDTPYPHHGFTWFPKVTSNVSTTEGKEWFEKLV